MAEFLTLIFLVVIGAVIGGATNIIAIRMIFRPFRAYYIGSFKVPFTPGLIPKRRAEIAEQFGKIVEEYLVTPEGIGDKILQPSFIKSIEERIKELIHQFVSQESTLSDLLELQTNGIVSTRQIEEAFQLTVKNKLKEFVDERKEKPLKDLMTPRLIEKIENEIPKLTAVLLQSGQDYFDSYEGRREVEQLVESFFESKGNVANTIAKLIKKTSPENLLTNELTKLLKQEETSEIINGWLIKEWRKLISKSPDYFLENIEIDEMVDRIAVGIVKDTPIIGDLNKSIHTWAPAYEEKIVQVVLPFTIQLVVEGMKKNLSPLLQSIGLSDIVKDQVNNFPLILFEKMLLSIISRELGMIAILGALIGGIIGFVQWIIFLIIT